MRSRSAFFQIIDPGVQVSLQDGGRLGYAGFGVPESGFMDTISAGRANLVLGNTPDHPCLEFAPGRVQMLVRGSCQVVFSGAEVEIEVNGVRCEQLQVISLQDGTSIHIKPGKFGNWLYMAINGKWHASDLFGSKSFYPLVTDRAGYLSGECAYFSRSKNVVSTSHALVKNKLFWLGDSVEAYKGPEFELLDLVGRQQLSGQAFEVTAVMNRMGYQLAGKVTHQLPEILSAPVYPGTIQLTPSGNLIVLMKDAQVTGGYPRVLQLTPKSLAMLSQKRAGDTIVFKVI
ncbi:Allophanate hydrolase 2 subunit 2 [Lunatimonas lonarensis]|uniref:Allophanate hydrolase 2 subunit 2 n=1 Tax=Lunatimonas lonarensis TaxID=1232681 RepID=R7ZQS2_9BACT|nr:biotin-dependent carboxyltransferase family protein [Lunatimonas lonarensis]EON76403.1 Allophanate hydrolase 2 subunit 2 [Lunatimonas lonarensis]